MLRVRGLVPPRGTRVSRSDYLNIAEGFAAEIWSRRALALGGSVVWLDTEQSGSGGARRQGVLGPYLYDGTTGIALFFAALAHQLNDSRYQQHCLETLAPVRKKFRSLAEQPGRAEAHDRLGIGGFRGLGSIVYSFALIGRWLGEPSLVAEAHDLMKLITPTRVERDGISDVLLGSAGAILALLTLRGLEDSPEEADHVLEVAAVCASRLMGKRTRYRELPPAWTTLPGFPPLGGFAHGAAGIAFSLLKLYEVTNDSRLLNLALEGYTFERSIFSRRDENWRDMRFPAASSFRTSWCYGAPGIALGRLGGLGVLDDRSVRNEICSGLKTTARAPLVSLDHLCCGNMGRVDVLLYAGSRLGDARFQAAAETLAREIRLRADARGWTWRLDQQRGFFDPTFFTGAAGVGYAFLRLAEPTMPCVLLLEGLEGGTGGLRPAVELRDA